MALSALGLEETVPVVTRDLVPHGKPDPDLFVEAARRLGVDIADAVVVGDSVWDLLAARTRPRRGAPLGRLRRRGLERAGAYRVYEDPRDFLRHLDEIGVRALDA